MPRNADADRALVEARESLAGGALDRARDAAWRAASGGAQVGDIELLEEVATMAAQLAERGEDVEQLRVYVDACLEDARAGKRPPSWFERLLSRDRRRR